MKLTFSKIFSKEAKPTKGGSVGTNSGSTAVWIGATVVFALLFFLSSVLDMKVNVTFGQANSGGFTTSNTTGSTQQSAPTTGIASQVGGC